MIPVITNRDIAKLKSHARTLIEQGNYEGLVIMLEELQDTNFKLPIFNETRPSFTPMQLVAQATREEHLKIMDYIFDNYKFSVSTKIYMLSNACHTNKLKAVMYLIEKQNAGISKNILHWAAEYGSKPISEYLSSVVSQREALKNDSSNNS